MGIHLTRYAEKNVMCARVLDAQDGTQYKLSIWPPVEDPNGGEHFVCDFKIEGQKLNIEMFGIGVDGLQAILASLKIARAYLLESEVGSNLGLSWMGDRQIGLPTNFGGWED